MNEQPHDGPVVEPRYPASAVPWISSVRLGQGDVVELINISRSGVLVESPTRLVPGTALIVTLESAVSPVRTRGKVVRCQVSAIMDGSLRYHCGIQFDGKLQVLDFPPGAAPEPKVTPMPEQTPAAGPRVVANRW